MPLGQVQRARKAQQPRSGRRRRAVCGLPPAAPHSALSCLRARERARARRCRCIGPVPLISTPGAAPHYSPRRAPSIAPRRAAPRRAPSRARLQHLDGGQVLRRAAGGGRADARAQRVAEAPARQAPLRRLHQRHAGR